MEVTGADPNADIEAPRVRSPLESDIHIAVPHALHDALSQSQPQPHQAQHQHCSSDVNIDRDTVAMTSSNAAATEYGNDIRSSVNINANWRYSEFYRFDSAIIRSAVVGRKFIEGASAYGDIDLSSTEIFWRRMPQNPKDSNAIQVCVRISIDKITGDIGVSLSSAIESSSETPRAIGYLPAQLASVLSPLIDASAISIELRGIRMSNSTVNARRDSAAVNVHIRQSPLDIYSVSLQSPDVRRNICRMLGTARACQMSHCFPPPHVSLSSSAAAIATTVSSVSTSASFASSLNDDGIIDGHYINFFVVCNAAVGRYSHLFTADEIQRWQRFVSLPSYVKHLWIRLFYRKQSGEANMTAIVNADSDRDRMRWFEVASLTYDGIDVPAAVDYLHPIVNLNQPKSSSAIQITATKAPSRGQSAVLSAAPNKIATGIASFFRSAQRSSPSRAASGASADDAIDLASDSDDANTSTVVGDNKPIHINIPQAHTLSSLSDIPPLAATVSHTHASAESCITPEVDGPTASASTSPSASVTASAIFIDRSSDLRLSGEELYASLVSSFTIAQLRKLLDALAVKKFSGLRVDAMREATLGYLKSQRSLQGRLLVDDPRTRTLITKACGEYIRINSEFLLFCQRLHRLFYLDGSVEQRASPMLLMHFGVFRFNPIVAHLSAHNTRPIFATRRTFIAYEQALDAFYRFNQLMEIVQSEMKSSSSRSDGGESVNCSTISAMVRQARLRFDVEDATPQCTADMPPLVLESSDGRNNRNNNDDVSADAADAAVDGDGDADSTIAVDVTDLTNSPKETKRPRRLKSAAASKSKSKRNKDQAGKLSPPQALFDFKPWTESPVTAISTHASSVANVSVTAADSDNDRPLPPFVQNLRAVSLYASMIHYGVTVFEKAGRYAEAIELLIDLLSRRHLPRRRGGWWNRLILNIDTHLGQPSLAYKIACIALSDSCVRTGDLFDLKRRAVRLWRSVQPDEPCPVSDEWRKSADAVAERRGHHRHASLDDVKSLVIRGRPLNKTTGSKSRFVGYDDEIVSVEELVLQFYKMPENGGWRGQHCENSLLMMLFGLLMWDVIFAPVSDVFPHPCLDAPLDLGDDSFFESRRELIDSRVAEIAKSCPAKLIEVAWLNYGIRCRGVNWDEWLLEEVQTIAEGIGSHALANVCLAFATDFNGWSGGLPDLCLYKIANEVGDAPRCYCNSNALQPDAVMNDNTAAGCVDAATDVSKSAASASALTDSNKRKAALSDDVNLNLNNGVEARFKLVEVKGPRDRLSSQQAAWLAKLSSLIHLEIAYVKEGNIKTQHDCDENHNGEGRGIDIDRDDSPRDSPRKKRKKSRKTKAAHSTAADADVNVSHENAIVELSSGEDA